MPCLNNLVTVQLHPKYWTGQAVLPLQTDPVAFQETAVAPRQWSVRTIAWTGGSKYAFCSIDFSSLLQANPSCDKIIIYLEVDYGPSVRKAFLRTLSARTHHRVFTATFDLAEKRGVVKVRLIPVNDLKSKQTHVPPLVFVFYYVHSLSMETGLTFGNRWLPTSDSYRRPSACDEEMDAANARMGVINIPSASPYLTTAEVASKDACKRKPLSVQELLAPEPKRRLDRHCRKNARKNASTPMASAKPSTMGLALQKRVRVILPGSPPVSMVAAEERWRHQHQRDQSVKKLAVLNGYRQHVLMTRYCGSEKQAESTAQMTTVLLRHQSTESARDWCIKPYHRSQSCTNCTRAVQGFLGRPDLQTVSCGWDRRPVVSMHATTRAEPEVRKTTGAPVAGHGNSKEEMHRCGFHDDGQDKEGHGGETFT